MIKLKNGNYVDLVKQDDGVFQLTIGWPVLQDGKIGESSVLLSTQELKEILLGFARKLHGKE